MTNAMESGTGAAVFETAARFNHSCVPNAFFGWNKEKSEERIFAIFDIQIGEEITLSYCDPFHDHSQRRWELQHYGFTCFCPACTNLDDPDSFGFKSRERRWRLSELDDAMAYPGDFAEKLKAKIETAKLMREEGLSGTCLGDTYVFSFLLSHPSLPSPFLPFLCSMPPLIILSLPIHLPPPLFPSADRKIDIFPSPA